MRQCFIPFSKDESLRFEVKRFRQRIGHERELQIPFSLIILGGDEPRSLYSELIKIVNNEQCNLVVGADKPILEYTVRQHVSVSLPPPR